MMRILQLIYSLIVMNKNNNNEPVRLGRKNPKQKRRYNIPNIFKFLTKTEIILIITVLIILAIISWIIFQTGSLESTGVYNNRLA